MSYYVSNYYRNPGPVYWNTDKDEPVPGWGVLPNMAGPRMLGVGQAPPVQLAPPAPVAKEPVEPPPPAAGDGSPWWLWILGGGALGAGVGIAQNRGWLARAGLKR
jgi:hypothetical protein